jgi:hypothetical protein
VALLAGLPWKNIPIGSLDLSILVVLRLKSAFGLPFSLEREFFLGQVRWLSV